MTTATAPERRYIVDLCNTDGDDGLFPQIYSVDSRFPGSLTLPEAQARMAEYVFDWLKHWRRVAKGQETAPGLPRVPAELAPQEIEHWQGIGRHWSDITVDDIDEQPTT